VLNGRGHESPNIRIMTSAYMKAKGHREIWNDLKANKAYRVPAKCRDLLEMRTTFISRPKIDSLTCLKCPWTRATVQRVFRHLERIGSVRKVFQTNKFS